jgi:hypothetical protein
MKILGSISLGASSFAAAGLVIVQLVTAQPQKFALEARTFADVTSAFGGTWKLKQRINPDGTPYRSRLEGVTYVSMRTISTESIGPHAVAVVHATEKGIADSHFFDYPEGVAGKPFVMESAGTWLIHNVKSTDSGAQISARIFTMAKGTVPPYTDGMVIGSEIVYNVLRAAPRAGAAVVPRVEFARVIPGDLTDFSGAKLSPAAAATSCFGMTSLTVTPDTMNINWSNQGKDIWVKSSVSVPAEFR